MKIFIVTQNDPFFLPKFFEIFLHLIDDDIEVIGVNILKPFNSHHSWYELLKKYYGYLGTKEFILLGSEYVIYLLANFFRFEIFINKFFSVKRLIKKNKIPVFSIEKLNSIQFQKLLKCDLLISVACPKILNKKIINIPKYGSINFHSGFLPKYRGINPSFWALLNGEKFSAITVHKMDEKLDNGPIIKQKIIDIDSNATLYSLLNRVSCIGPRVLFDAIKMINKKSFFIGNDRKKSTYYGFPSKKDGKLFRSKGLKFR